MNGFDLLILAVLALALFFALRSVLKRRKKGGCGCGCADCDGSCPSMRPDKKG